MKKVILAIFCLLLVTGCSKDDTEPNNELTIRNSALAAVVVNFRGTAYSLNVGETKSVNEIPNGTYSYETSFSLPSGATSFTKGTHLDEALTFNGETKYTIYFVGSLIDEVYEINATLSTSNQDETETTANLLNPR